MGGGYGRGLDFGATWGSGKLPLAGFEPETLPETNIQIGRSLGAKALNYDIKDPHTGRIFRFLEGTTIRNVEVFAGKGVRNKLNPKVALGLSQQLEGALAIGNTSKESASLITTGRAEKPKFIGSKPLANRRSNSRLRGGCRESKIPGRNFIPRAYQR